MKISAPEILKRQWAIALRFAFFDCPIEARNAVIVVPMLSPRRIGIAPESPIMLVIPSPVSWEAKFCRTAIVALEL